AQGGFGFYLARVWDFTPASLGGLPLFWKIPLGGLALWGGWLLLDHPLWLMFRNKQVEFRLFHRRAVRGAEKFKAPFAFLKFLGFENQIYRPEVLEYEVKIPGWPKEFSGLSIVQ